MEVTRRRPDCPSRLPTIVETVGQAYFSYSPGMSPSACDDVSLSEYRLGDAVLENNEGDTPRSMKGQTRPSLPAIEEMTESHVNYQRIFSTEPTYLPWITPQPVVAAPAKTSLVHSMSLARGLSLIDRTATLDDFYENEIVARITRTLPTPLMRKMTLSEDLVTHKRRLLESSRKLASRDLLTDPRWKSLERVLKEDDNHR